MPKAICSVMNCEGKHFCRGFCNPHYQRWAKGGDAQPEVPVKSGTRRKGKCSVDGCEKPHYVRGWCKSHYERWKKNGDVRPEIPIANRASREGACRVEGCGRPIDARRLCNGHMVREDKWGDVLADVPIRQRSDGRCSVSGCEGDHSGLGWCDFHYQPYRLYKLTPDDFAVLMARQGGACAICGCVPPPVARLTIDHDHACCPQKKRSCGKCVRGLLCGPCNSLLGLARDDTSILRAATAYLNAWDQITAQE